MEALAAMDALMLTAETLGSAMHVGVVLTLSPPTGAAAGYIDELYRDSLTDPHQVDRRLRRHPHRGLDTGGVWVWREAAEVDLRRHLLRVTLPPGSGSAALWRAVSELHGERLDLGAPPWACWLIDGLPDGRFAFYIKVHHIVVDGVGGLQMISDSLSPDPRRRAMPPFYAEKRDAGPAATAHHRLPGPLAAVRAVADAAAAGLELTRNVARAELATVVGSLVSNAVVGPLEAPRTRFNTRLGPRRAATGTSLDRARIAAVTAAAGVTGNDVVTAVVGGALRAWLAGRGELPEQSLVAMCPVSVRAHDDAGAALGGNRFGLGLCPLGTDLADPADRLDLVHRAMAVIKNQVHRNGADAMLAVMGPAIGSTVALPLLPFGTPVPPSCNIAISNVPGPREVMYYNGSRLEEIFPVSTVFDGMALNVTVCSYADRLEVGYVADAAVVDDIDTLVGLTERALVELEARTAG